MNRDRAASGPLITRAAVPMPIQVVIDDVGWWCGEDGHERNEPFRTGIRRNHVPEDYEAIVDLGRRLNMRPQAAFVLCEWDRENILGESPSSTWMGAAWDNARWVGPWLDKAADIVRGHSDHVELVLHGIGHEYWQDGCMERAEWHDADGRMRPPDEVRRHLDLYARLLGQHRLGPFPQSFVPTAFLHRFGVADGGLASILAEAGIRFISTPFDGMHRDREPEHRLFGIDAGILTVDRGHDLCPWYAIAPDVQGAPEGAICGMHWPNLLHPDPARNGDVVDRWVRLLRPYGARVDTMLARDTASFAAQLVHHTCARVVTESDAAVIDLAGVAAVRDRIPVGGTFEVRLETPARCEFAAGDVRVEADEPTPTQDGFLHVVRVSADARVDGIRLKVKV